MGKAYISGKDINNLTNYFSAKEKVIQLNKQATNRLAKEIANEGVDPSLAKIMAKAFKNANIR